MRTTPLLLALIACDLTPSDPLDVPPAETCWDPAPLGAGVDAEGNVCSTANSPIGYSLLGPAVRLLIDKSGSMSGSRWDEVLGLLPYLPLVEARAQLGLSVFPVGDHDCGTARSSLVDVGPNNAEAIGLALRRQVPGGRTPIAAVLERAARDPGIHCTNRDNIVVLLTDGEESCEGDPIQAVSALANGSVPVEVFVIGFGVGSDTRPHLQAIANAARGSTTGQNFFTASTTGELLERLAAVTGTCTAQLDRSVGGELGVRLDGRDLELCTEARCEQGFLYDPTHDTVELQGEDCLAIQDGTCHDLQFFEI